MNPHFHPYTELNSPHSPADNNNYHHHHHHGPGGGMLSNGHMTGGGPPQQPPDPQQQGPPFSNQGGPPNNAIHQHNNGLSCGQVMTPSGVMNSPPPPTVKVCAGCGGKIMERFLLHALDRYWHNGCLKCSCCGAMLADIGSSCFTKAGMILCKTDYVRLFGNTGACSACGQTIPASDYVMRAGQGHVYHLKCFACSKCQLQLVPGDRYYLLAGSVVCEQDWHKMLKGSGVASGTGTGVRKGKVGRPRRSRD